MARSDAHRRAESERCAYAWRCRKADGTISARRSPVAGVAQRIRSAAAPGGRGLPRDPKTYRANNKARTHRRGVHPHRQPAAAVDRSQYLPHSNKREAQRHTDQIAAGSLRAENGLR